MHSSATSGGAFATSSRQQPLLSASEQLQSYINRFERSQGSTPAPTVYDSFDPDQQPGAKSDDTGDAWDLLCGRAGGHVSVKTRGILRDVDRKLGYTEPCYSAQEKLNLRSYWPSMHEHLERRWRQQLRERYEVRQLTEAAAEATAAEALSRADLYRYRQKPTAGKQQPIPLQSKSKEKIPVPVRACADSSDIEDDAAENSVSESGRSSLAVGTAAAARSSEERLWGSDSGIGQSCNGAATATATAAPARAPAVAPTAAADANDDAADDDKREVSFEERMRSYRCVLEAHELSSRLRQHLEAACATVGSGGKRVLSIEDKGRIRDRLARLQGPLRGGFIPPDDVEQQPKRQQPEPEAERITTERLSRLMSSVRSVLSTRDAGGEEDRLWMERLSKQQEQQAQSETQQVMGDAALEADQ